MDKQDTDLPDVAIEQVETVAKGTEIQMRVERKSAERGRRLRDEQRVDCLLMHVQRFIVDFPSCRLMSDDWKSKWQLNHV